jgi:hypothetical protein
VHSPFGPSPFPGGGIGPQKLPFIVGVVGCGGHGTGGGAGYDRGQSSAARPHRAVVVVVAVAVAVVDVVSARTFGAVDRVAA